MTCRYQRVTPRLLPAGAAVAGWVIFLPLEERVLSTARSESGLKARATVREGEELEYIKDGGISEAAAGFWSISKPFSENLTGEDARLTLWRGRSRPRLGWLSKRTGQKMARRGLDIARSAEVCFPCTATNRSRTRLRARSRYSCLTLVLIRQKQCRLKFA